MTTRDVANCLVSLCRQGRWEEAQRSLYHQDIISIEPDETGGEVSKGLKSILAKNQKWAEMTEKVHRIEISDPLIADGFFGCTMTMDVTLKGKGRLSSTELCVYKVVDGKIVQERFFHE